MKTRQGDFSASLRSEPARMHACQNKCAENVLAGRELLLAKGPACGQMGLSITPREGLSASQEAIST